MNENLPNGIPGTPIQHDPMKPTDRFVPFNGVGSSHSSRDSSPGPRSQIPLSQLPPSKMEIPPGQLPPRMSNLSSQMGRISLTKSSEQTPFSSPKVFTSTPVLEPTASLKSNLISPIGSSKPKESNAFTHSLTSQFASVKTERKEVPEEKDEEKKVSSFFNKSGANGSLKDLRNVEDDLFNYVKSQNVEQKSSGHQNIAQSVPQTIKMNPTQSNQEFSHQQIQQQTNITQNVPQPIKINQGNQNQPFGSIQNQQASSQNVPQQIKMPQSGNPTNPNPQNQFGLIQGQSQQINTSQQIKMNPAGNQPPNTQSQQFGMFQSQQIKSNSPGIQLNQPPSTQSLQFGTGSQFNQPPSTQSQQFGVLNQSMNPSNQPIKINQPGNQLNQPPNTQSQQFGMFQSQQTTTSSQHLRMNPDGNQLNQPSTTQSQQIKMNPVGNQPPSTQSQQFDLLSQGGSQPMKINQPGNHLNQPGNQLNQPGNQLNQPPNTQSQQFEPLSQSVSVSSQQIKMNQPPNSQSQQFDALSQSVNASGQQIKMNPPGNKPPNSQSQQFGPLSQNTNVSNQQIKTNLPGNQLNQPPSMQSQFGGLSQQSNVSNPQVKMNPPGNQPPSTQSQPFGLLGQNTNVSSQQSKMNLQSNQLNQPPSSQSQQFGALGQNTVSNQPFKMNPQGNQVNQPPSVQNQFGGNQQSQWGGQNQQIQQQTQGFSSFQQQKGPGSIPPISQSQQKGFTSSESSPQIQPHLQQQGNQSVFQQMRMPPPKSNSFPGLNQNVSSSAISSDNKAHLHANRYPQRPNVGGQDQQNNFSMNQNVSGYQNPPISGYQGQNVGHQSQTVGHQGQNVGYQSQNSGYQTQNSGYQVPSGGYQSQSGGYQNQTSGYQVQSGYQIQTSGYQPQAGNYPTQTSNYQTQTNYQTQSSNYQTSPYQSKVVQSGFNKLWGNENYDLLQCPNILPTTKVEPPKINLGQEFLNASNCNPDIFRCTMTKIPESTTLLQKSRLPLGVLIHPFKDLSNLPVIQCNTIVRCRTCRTYINPFVFFVDSKRWKCNLCYRVNELPEEFQYDPVSKTYGDPSRRPEVRSSTIEYIAPAEYMLRPPQPAIYLYLFDVSRLAVESGYLQTVCNVLSTEIKNIPGDARTQIGFLCYDSCLHFYSLAEGQNQPHEMTVLDIDDVFIPCPDNLLVNLQDRMELVMDLLSQLPTRFFNNHDTNSALGAALQAAYKMTSATGGRITVFQTILPNKGPGSVVSREDPNQRSSNEVHHLNPANDFYKRLALECSGQQIAVDLFILNSQYVDLATISGISRFSGGCIYHFPLFKASRTIQNDSFERTVTRYVTRKIGFEAVMRVRCTRGLSIHTFHGNLFVRSTDLLALPNINPDAGFGMQVSIEENLSDVQTICFQAALLYTSSKGERRIRVHTLCLPVANTLHDIMNSADQQCIIGLLAKMAVDRSMQSSLSDAREAFLNVAIDILTSYKIQLNMGSSTSGLMAPNNLKLLPLYISALLKSVAFRVGTSTRLDDRVRAMCDMKTKPLPYLIQQIYPDLYPVHNLEEQNTILNEEEEQIPLPPHLQLTARNLDSNGAYLMDMGENIILFVCANVSQSFLKDVLDVPDFNSLSEDIHELPVLNNTSNKMMQMFLNYLNDDKPFPATFQVIKDNSPQRVIFLERLIEDRLENSLSYHEFLQHVKTQVK